MCNININLLVGYQNKQVLDFFSLCLILINYMHIIKATANTLPLYTDIKFALTVSTHEN